MVKKRKLNKAKKRKRFYKANRNHKSSLFCLSFREKEHLLELCNAVNGTAYTNPDDVTVCTLEDAVYIGIKNDISFLFGEMLNLYEHQSTRNPNMPMRGLLYLARNYESYIEQNQLNIYGKAQVKFPLPQYYVFYNGKEDEPDRRELWLTDAFSKIEGKESCLECKAVLLNINYGHNIELMEKCQRLKDYAVFIHYIREKDVEMNLTDAVDYAIDRCIEEGILKDLLTKCRGEVRNMVLSTYNKEAYERDLKEEGREEGLRLGKDRMKKELNELYKKLLDSGKKEELEKALRDETYLEKLLQDKGYLEKLMKGSDGE